MSDFDRTASNVTVVDLKKSTVLHEDRPSFSDRVRPSRENFAAFDRIGRETVVGGQYWNGSRWKRGGVYYTRKKKMKKFVESKKKKSHVFYFFLFSFSVAVIIVTDVRCSVYRGVLTNNNYDGIMMICGNLQMRVACRSSSSIFLL